MTKIYSSPLNYPGGKKWLYKKLLPLIPHDVDHIVSPFLGGGVMELNWAASGYKVSGYDIDEALVMFWQAWLADAEGIFEKAQRLLAPYSDSDEVRPLLFPDKWKKDPVLYYIRNRFSWFGIMTHGLGKHQNIDGVWWRVNKIARVAFVRDTLAPKATMAELPMSVQCQPFTETISQNSDAFFYCDPPYYTTEHLYESKKESFDHAALRELLQSC